MKSYVIRNIPNHGDAHQLVNKLRMRGIHTRKRGRGARASYKWGVTGISRNEHQDLPIEKAARFSMYFAPADWQDREYPMIYTDYAGEREGKPVVRIHHDG